MLKINDLAPLKIKVLDQNGELISLSETLGKPGVVYFRYFVWSAFGGYKMTLAIIMILVGAIVYLVLKMSSMAMFIRVLMESNKNLKLHVEELKKVYFEEVKK